MKKICFWFKTFSVAILIMSLSGGLVLANGSFDVQARSEAGFQFKNPYNKTVAVNFKSAGKWTVWPVSGYHTANGILDQRRSGVLKDAPNGALIVRRGNGRYEFVGSERTILLEPEENISFMMNEAPLCSDGAGSSVSCYIDNKGSVTVTWTLEQ